MFLAERFIACKIQAKNLWYLLKCSLATIWGRMILFACRMISRAPEWVSLRAKRSNLFDRDCFVASLLAMTLFFFIVLPAFALTDGEKKEMKDEAKNFQYHTVTTKSGLQFRVPEDMLIETRNGIEAPIPFDEYSYGKFKKIDERLDRIEGTLARIEKVIYFSQSQEKLKV